MAPAEVALLVIADAQLAERSPNVRDRSREHGLHSCSASSFEFSGESSKNRNSDK